MRKVAYNADFGGFSLSTKAVLLARKLSNDPQWGKVVLHGETYPDGQVNTSDWNSHHIQDIQRHDPVLIQVIEQLGIEANGKYADLRITEVEHLYRIHEYDGMESVFTLEEDAQSYVQ